MPRQSGKFTAQQKMKLNFPLNLEIPFTGVTLSWDPCNLFGRGLPPKMTAIAPRVLCFLIYGITTYIYRISHCEKKKLMHWNALTANRMRASPMEAANSTYQCTV